ncbi:MAG: beta-galactosidase, partial [Lentisphaerae bacterium]
MMTVKPRYVELWKDDWKFSREFNEDALQPEFDDSNWQSVRVPHDWAIEGPFDRENDLQQTAILEDGERKTIDHTGRTGGLPHVGQAC